MSLYIVRVNLNSWTAGQGRKDYEDHMQHALRSKEHDTSQSQDIIWTDHAISSIVQSKDLFIYVHCTLHTPQICVNDATHVQKLQKASLILHNFTQLVQRFKSLN